MEVIYQRWTKIESKDDLPKAEDVYWFSSKSSDVESHLFTPTDKGSVAFILRRYAAWMPKEKKPKPYKSSQEEALCD